MQPDVNPRGKGDVNETRGPRDVTIMGRSGPVAVPGPAYGPWDVDADSELVADTPPPLGTPARRSLAPRGATGPTRSLTKAQVKAAKLTQVVLALRAEGESVQDIAARLGVAASTVTGWITAHRRAVTADELDDVLDRIAVPLATENLIHGLIAGDKDYTLETLKGRGQLKRHSEGDGKPSTVLPELRIVFEANPGPMPMADGGATGAGVLTRGQIMGAISVPKAVTGPVIDVQAIPHAPQAADE